MARKVVMLSGAVPKNVIARSPQATKQSNPRSSLRAPAGDEAIQPPLVIASEAKQSCGIAGDGQIAAPFGLAMTNGKRARNDSVKIGFAMTG